MKEIIFSDDRYEMNWIRPDYPYAEVKTSKRLDIKTEHEVQKDFFTKRREEVTRVMTLDFTFERRLELQREEATEEGRELKLQEQIRKKLLKNKTSEQIADELEEPLEVILPLCDQIEKELHPTT